MTTLNARMRACILGAAATALALAAPAVAGAKTSTQHHLKMYKVQQQLTIEDGETEVLSLACKKSYDLAADGMWLVDNVSSNPQVGEGLPFNQFSGVDVLTAESDPANAYQYNFVIRNNSEENAQVKLFVTCLRGKTTYASPNHRHDLLSYDVSDTTPTWGAGPRVAQLTCPSGKIAVAPGFRIDSGFAKLGKSLPSSVSTSHPYDERRWNWGFYVTAASTSIRMSVRCLDERLSMELSGKHKHRHKVLAKIRDATATIKAGEVGQPKINCGQHEKALVAGFDATHGDLTATAGNSTPTAYEDHPMWFLGMEPQIKSRVYKFQNPTAGDRYVDLFATCVNDRTGKKVTS